MPKFKTNIWKEYEIKLFHYDNDVRSIIRIIPFFWDSEVVFDLGISPHKVKSEITDVWGYQWELCDLDGQIVKKGQSSVNIKKLGIKRIMKGYWSFGEKRAVILGYLPPNRHYQLYMTFVDKEGNTSDRFSMVTFTTKDRDEVYMQLFISLIVIIAGIIIGLIIKGSS